MQRLKQIREVLALSQRQMGEALGGYPVSSLSAYELGTRKLPPEIREKLYTWGIAPEWLETGNGSLFRPGVAVEIAQTDSGVQVRSVPAPPDKAGKVVRAVTLAGPGWDPNPPAEGFNVAEPQPATALPSICIAPDTVETSVRILGEALAQRGLHMPADRFATLCRMAAEMVTLEKRAGMSGTLQEMVNRRVTEILEMVVKGV